ncbi:MAG TPA: prepilin-type N-terminal cleavage/methylation domain-containing protein [Gemmatimonadales bacterium]|nr:prepilin-type N-terminal cleavage/methylation domain-containing protein [Gemmatimonadales bacterium]
MPLLARRGFTLIELMVALVLMGLVSTAVYKVLVSNQRLYLAQTQQIDLQQNIRAAATILPAEFRELDAADGDITGMGPDSIRMRAMRQLAFVCNTPALGGGIGQLDLTIRATPMYGNRLSFAAGDSLLVYWEGDPSKRSDDIWLPAQVQSILATGAVCNDSGPTLNQGFSLRMQPNWINNAALNIANAITRGAPVRGYDKVVYRTYQAADGNWYLGQRNPAQGGTIQPVIGPLIGANGVTFSYYDSIGAVTNLPTQVAQIEIVLRARTASPIRSGGAGVQAYKVDSMVTRVALRNNPRCGPGSMPPRPCN